MARSKTRGQPAWLTMGEAMAAVRAAGKHPEEAAAILFAAIGRGTLIGRADHLRIECTDGVTEYHDHVVPAGVLDLGPMPPLGHPFWSIGNVRVRPAPLPDGGTVTIAGQTIVVPLGGLLPVYTIRGLRVPQEAVQAICRSLAASSKIGRRKGIGGYASEDEALIREMHGLRTERPETSVHAAAMTVAPKARGASLVESKVRRLMDRYRAAFPDPH